MVINFYAFMLSLNKNISHSYPASGESRNKNKTVKAPDN